MARFFVGQRVRVIAARCEEWQFAVGAETWIDEDFGDSWHLALHEPDGLRACVLKDEAASFLVPILPSGHAACDEDFKRDLDKLLEGVSA